MKTFSTGATFSKIGIFEEFLWKHTTSMNFFLGQKRMQILFETHFFTADIHWSQQIFQDLMIFAWQYERKCEKSCIQI
jgi:hypothetical protein